MPAQRNYSHPAESQPTASELIKLLDWDSDSDASFRRALQITLDEIRRTYGSNPEYLNAMQSHNAAAKSEACRDTREILTSLPPAMMREFAAAMWRHFDHEVNICTQWDNSRSNFTKLVWNLEPQDLHRQQRLSDLEAELRVQSTLYRNITTYCDDRRTAQEIKGLIDHEPINEVASWMQDHEQRSALFRTMTKFAKAMERAGHTQATLTVMTRIVQNGIAHHTRLMEDLGNLQEPHRLLDEPVRDPDTYNAIVHAVVEYSKPYMASAAHTTALNGIKGVLQQFNESIERINELYRETRDMAKFGPSELTMTWLHLNDANQKAKDERYSFLTS